MPIDPSVALGAEVGQTTFSWNASDIALYHLASAQAQTRWTRTAFGICTTPNRRCFPRSLPSPRASTRPSHRRSPCPASKSTLPQWFTVRKR